MVPPVLAPMSDSIEIRTQPADASHWAPRPRWRPLMPAVVLTFLIAGLFFLRLPAALVPIEFNVDESQLLAEAMKLAVAPLPWKAVDSCGVLDSGFLSIFIGLGIKPSYILAHLLATLLLCLQVCVAYLTLKRLASTATALTG